MTGPAVCAGCGRPIASSVATRCPVCRHPVRRPAEAVSSMRHRPDAPVPVAEPAPQVVQQPAAGTAGGRICRDCGHPNARQRIRCESCAKELRPGEASPQPPPRAQPPRVPPPPPPRRWPVVLAVLGVLALMVALYLVAYALV